MLQRNHFFLVADMYLGTPDPTHQECLDEEGCEGTIVSSFDLGLDKTAEFEKLETGATLHWNDQIQQTKSIGPWLNFHV